MTPVQRYRLSILIALAALLLTGLGPARATADDTATPAISVSSPERYRSSYGRHKLLVRNLPQGRLQSAGSSLIADYDAFQVIEADNTAFATLASDAEVRDDYNLIVLNAGPIDTTAPGILAQRQKAGSFDGRRLWLIQFSGPVLPEWYDALAATGVRIINAVPSNTYLVYGDSAQLAALGKLAASAPYVQWDGPFGAAYRLMAGMADDKEQTVAIQLVDDPAANADTLALIETLRRSPAHMQSALGYINVFVTIPAGALTRLTTQPDILSIQPYAAPELLDERQDQIVAGNTSGGAPIAGNYLNWLATQGFTQAQFDASGFVVDIADSGIDDGTTAPNHFGLHTGGTTGGASRIVYTRLEGIPNAGSTLAGLDGHGTLNAHIIGGFVPNGSPFNTFPHADASGFRYGLGVAPFVRMGSSVIFDPDSYTFPSLTGMVSRAYQSGARISSNSWGSSNSSGVYNSDSQVYDALVRDAQPAGAAVSVGGNQELVVVFAAGNDGPLTRTVTSPGTAKNVISVGASENVRAIGGADGSGVDDTGANNLNDIINFSSRGPTADGRIKPDLVAPGTHITGGVVQTNSPAANGTADPGYTGSGVSGGAGGVPFFPNSQQWYTSSSGTSHSTPAVAGGAALVRQHFLNRGLGAPSPAMTKAYLVHGAAYLNGVGANDSLFSPNQGMGLMQLSPLFDTTTQRILRDQVAADLFTAPGQQRVFSGYIADPSKPLRISLAWTDAPGSTIGNAYLNNLNLRVSVGTITYLGNNFSGANSIPSGVSDNRNNLESVFLPAGLPVGTPVIITVEATGLIADGVPNNLTPLDQDFALAVSNLAEALIPAVTVERLSISGETILPINGAPEPRERITVDLALRNSGTASTSTVTATLQSGGGAIDVTGTQSYGVLPALSPIVTRSFSFTVDPALACGGALTLSFTLADGATNLDPLVRNYAIGALTAGAPITGTNGGAISIPAGAPVITEGAANPYPSGITVSGVPGPILDVGVTLRGLSHAFPEDLEVLLVGPGGQSVLLMEAAGGAAAVSGLNLTFSDSAANAIPDNTTLSSGSYRPAGYGAATFPAPAPAGPYGTALAAYDGLNANGVWSLYINDDGPQDVGSIANGWSIAITPEARICRAPTLDASPAALMTAETGYANDFLVVLSAKPTAPVTVTLTGDPSEGVLSTSSLTFTPADWYLPQSVIVTGVNDGIPDPVTVYPIQLSAASADSAYHGQVGNVIVTNVEQFTLSMPTIVKP